MLVVIAPDSFKECLKAPVVAEAIAAGWRRARPGDTLKLVPMADGGEGTAEALVAATEGQFREIEVPGPLGEPVTATYGMLGDGQTAVIEMAAASGLHLVPADRRDPRITSTHGTGELIADALDNGARKLIIGIGGSATNDGGAGMAQALGYSLRDASGTEIGPGGAELAQAATIDGSKRHPALADAEILVACDVTNPLCGPNGASAVYGPQKGASPEAVQELDNALRHFAELIAASMDVDVLDIPGAGAAGGLGAGLVAFAGGTLRPGVALVADACGLEGKVQGAGLVITGEGRIDGQTMHGKTPAGVARIAKQHTVPVIAFAGALGEGYKALYGDTLDAVFSIAPRPVSYEEALAHAAEYLADSAEAAARLWSAAHTGGA